MGIFGNAKHPCHPTRRTPKRHETARFLALYQSLASQSNLTIPPILLKELGRGGDKLNLRNANLLDPHIQTLAATLRTLPIYGKINLDNNAISSVGIESLVSVMKDHLERLVSLQYDPTEMAELREVAVGGNPISPSAGEKRERRGARGRAGAGMPATGEPGDRGAAQVSMQAALKILSPPPSSHMCAALFARVWHPLTHLCAPQSACWTCTT